ncbi:MAG: peptide chain release factor N(5)-glutamine methyltransferase [Myxococcaceae bacterium]
MSEPVWTVRRVLGWTTQHFERHGVDAPRLASELLLAHVLGLDRVRLYTDLDRPLDKGELAAYRSLLSARVEGTPVQYLTGRRDFYGRTFRVDARVLIPRPETEGLVENVLLALPKNQPLRLLDVATGSGCIAVTLAAERPLATVMATDVDEGACELARTNAEAQGVGGRVEVRPGDLFLPVATEAPFDAVVSNPPYVATEELPGLQAEVQREPRLALDGGPEGLRLLSRVVEGAYAHLVPGGLLALEMGERHGPAVRNLLLQRGYEAVRIEPDFERRDRMAFGTRPRG